jgi:1-acyl-sn-glycerol-3-phosphate acyltransferase
MSPAVPEPAVPDPSLTGPSLTGPSLTGPEGRSGSVPPRRRLPVTPADLRASLPSLPRIGGPFPLSPPTWPGTVPRPVKRSKLGPAYDSDWARRYPARFGRVLLTELVTRPALGAIARPQVDGADRLAHLHEPVIFAANHSSHVDTPLLLSVLPARWRHHTVVAGAADYFFDTRLKATAFAFAINAIPMERLRVSRDSVNRAAALLSDGWSLLIFPEGGRSPDGWAQHHTAGAAWLAVRTGLPVVPVHVAGTRNILPRGSNRLRPGTTHISFGHPIRPGQGTNPRDLAVRVEAAVTALADERTTDWWTAKRRAATATSPQLTGPDGGAWRRSWALGERDRNKRVADARRWPRP